MPLPLFFDSPSFTYVAIPFLIFIARVLDVSIGTIRLIFISRGYKVLAPLLGFFEILIWLSAIRQILLNLANVWGYIAYAGGFATGTFMGMFLEEKISIGKVMLRIITKVDTNGLFDDLKKERYVATSVHGDGHDSKVKIIFLITPRQDIAKVVGIIKKHDAKAYYTITDVRFASDNIPPVPRYTGGYLNIFRFYRRGK